VRHEAGEYAEAADRGRRLIELSGLLYNLARCESPAGRTGDAVEHPLAIARSERCRS
jgi:hypothetical protein